VWVIVLVSVLFQPGGTSIGRLRAADPLTMVPANVAGVVVLRNPSASLKKLNAFRAQIRPDSEAAELADLERGLNLDAGTIDGSRPLVLVLTRPIEVYANMVVVFTPKDPQALLEQGQGGENEVLRIDEGGVKQHLFVRDGVAMMSTRDKVLRRVAQRVSVQKSIVSTFDEEGRRLLDESDVCVHLLVPRWQERITPLVTLFVNMMKFGVAMQGESADPKKAAALSDWLLFGVQKILGDMRTITLSATFDGTAFRLVHHHRFRPESSTAHYLSQVRTSGRDIWEQVPDLPFVLMMVGDWHNTKEVPLSARFCEKMIRLESPADQPIGREALEVIESLKSCYGQIQGSYFMLSTPSNQNRPLQVLGGYVMKDAREGLRQLRFIHEHAGETLATALPGGGFWGRFEEVRRDGATYIEMRLSSERMNPRLRQNLYAVYGRGARFQKLAMDDHNLLYCLGACPDGVMGFARSVRTGPRAASNPRLMSVLKLLPERANVAILVDAARCSDMMLGIVSAEIGHAEPDGPAPARIARQADDADAPGPLVGYGLIAVDAALSGHLVARAADVARIIDLAEGFPKRLSAGAPRPAPSPPRIPDRHAAPPPR